MHNSIDTMKTGFIRNIKLKIADYFFRKEMKYVQRERSVVGFQEAKKIGILYDASSKNNYDLVRDFVRRARNAQKEVKSLGFIDSKKFPPDQLVKLGMDFFTLENLNWYFIPDSKLTDGFINENFDILINLNIEKCFPLEFISAFSKAKYRVGKYGDKSEMYYDLMITTTPEDDLKKFTAQVEHYLGMIKSC